MSDSIDRLIEKLDNIEEQSDIFILLKDNSEKLEIKKYKYVGISKSIHKDRVFLVAEDFSTLPIIYLEDIKEIFTSEQEKDAYLFDLKRREKESKLINMFIDIYKDKFTHIYKNEYTIQLLEIVENCGNLRNVLGIFDTTEEISFEQLPQNTLIPLVDLLSEY